MEISPTHINEIIKKKSDGLAVFEKRNIQNDVYTDNPYKKAFGKTIVATLKMGESSYAKKKNAFTVLSVVFLIIALIANILRRGFAFRYLQPSARCSCVRFPKSIVEKGCRLRGI